MNFAYTRENIDGVSIFHFVGQLAQENIEKISGEITPIVSSIGAIKLVIDMSNCDYINSRTIAHLAMWRQLMMNQGGELVIMQPLPQILDVLHVVGLDQIIRIVNSLDEVSPVAAQVPAEQVSTTT